MKNFTVLIWGVLALWVVMIIDNVQRHEWEWVALFAFLICILLWDVTRPSRTRSRHRDQRDDR